MCTMLNINNSAKIRLETYKKLAEKYNLKWDQCRYPKPTILLKNDFSRSKTNKEFYYYSFDSFPGNLEGGASEIIRLNYTGWYSDNYQDGLSKGAVVSFRNPHKLNEDGSHLQYLPATYNTNFDCITIYNEIYGEKEEAAKMADQYAKKEAEICRDDDAKFQAFEVQIPDLKEELHRINKKTLALIKEIKSGYSIRLLPETCKLVKNAILEAIERRTEIFERIESLNNNYWLSVE